MSQIQERPFATKTEGELFLMSEFLQREIKAMSEKSALVQAEMRFRSQAETAHSPNAPNGVDPTQGSTLDSYEDQSRAYAIRISLIAIAVILAAAVAVWFAA
jgi:hypothetical protein